MADAKISALTADTSPTSDDLIPTVNDPAGTPANRKVTLGNAITKAHGLSDGLLKVATGTMAVATAGTDYLTASSTNTLTNKSIDADTNTITNIENADIKAGAAIAVNKLAALTASRAVVSDGSGFVSAATTTAAEIGYVNGVTSAIQTQLDAKQPLDADLTTLATAFTSASATGAAKLAFHEDTDNGTNKVEVQGPASVASDKVLTLPDATDTLVGKATTDTLTNKTIDANGTGNSITNIEVADLAAGVLDTDLSSVSASDDTLPSAKATKAALDLKAPLASPTFTGTVTLPTGLTGVIRTDSGVVSVDSDVTDIVAAASTTVQGKVELATTAETETGTDTARAVTPDGLHDMTTLAGAAWFLDEDDMVSNSATKTASQQSIKAYVDASGGGAPEGTAVLSTGETGGVKFLREDGDGTCSWQVPAGSGDVSKVGTPANNQIGVWTGDGTIEGDANLTWDGTSFNIATAKNLQIAGSTILADSAGTTTLSNIDALDATTESTIEAAIDTLANLTSIQGRTVTLADAGANAIFGWDDVAGAYENLTQAEVLAVIGDSSATAKGVVELATDAETTTGTDATRAVTPDGLAGSDYGKRVIGILVSDPNGDAITTGDGKAYFRVPSVMNGWNLVGVAMSLTTASSSGIPTVQIRNSTQAADMLTTKLTIDANETDSSTAAAAAVIDTANDDVATGDKIHIDIDVAGTGAKGLFVELTFQLP